MKNSVSKHLRIILKWIFEWLGLFRRIRDGKFVLSPVILPNFIFQRIFGINSSCSWAVHFTSQVVSPENIEIGYRSEYCFATSGNCYFQAFNGIRMGDHVMFGPGTKIISAQHDLNDPTWARHTSSNPIQIGDRCWIGSNSILLPGVTLGRNVVVGAGAVVTKSFPDNVIIAGNPAKVIRVLESSSG